MSAPGDGALDRALQGNCCGGMIPAIRAAPAAAPAASAPPPPPRALRALVVGGSIGGLCAAAFLRGAGCEVAVFERSSSALAEAGAGLVVQPDLADLLERHGVARMVRAARC